MHRPPTRPQPGDLPGNEPGDQPCGPAQCARRRLTRREFVSAVAAAAALASGAGVPLAVATPLEHAPAPAVPQELEEFDFGAVELTGGPLKEQYDRIHASYLALENDRLLRVYRQGAGLPDPGAPMGGWYGRNGFVPGHSLGQYISGLARIGRTTGDPACHAKVQALVEGFALTLGASNRVFAAPNAEKLWPCYILDKHLIGLIDALRLSGLEQARAMIPRVYAGALPYIPARGRDRIGRKDPPYDETFVLPENLFTAYELTGDQTLLERARAYLLDREFFDPLAQGMDVLPGRHAYSHVIALSSAGKARLVLGEERYLGTMRNAWDLLRSEQQYATGGWGPDELFIEPGKGQLYASLSATQNHFETPCGSYAAIKLARYLLCATGDGRYGDGLERVAYNGLLAAKDPDGQGDYFYYSSYNAQARKGFYPKRWPCCSGTLVQGVADYVKDVYFRSAGGVAVNLYTPSRVRWQQGETAVVLEQQTLYPLQGAVRLMLACAHPVAFTLQLRIPSWVQTSPQVRVNGKWASSDVRRGFATLTRTWKNGDRVELEWPLPLRSEPIDAAHPHTAAVLRGPLVYVERSVGSGLASSPSPSHESSYEPGPAAVSMPLDIGKLQPVAGSPALLSLGSRSFAPFYQVRDETYTMYFDQA